MEAIQTYAQPISLVFLVGICFTLVKYTTAKVKETNEKLEEKVDRHNCHTHQKLICTKIDNIEKIQERSEKQIHDDITELKQDIKTLLTRE